MDNSDLILIVVSIISICDNAASNSLSVSLSVCQSSVGDGSGWHRPEEHQVDAALDPSPIPLPIHFLADDDHDDDDSRVILGMDQLFLPVHKHAQTSCLT